MHNAPRGGDDGVTWVEAWQKGEQSFIVDAQALGPTTGHHVSKHHTQQGSVFPCTMFSSSTGC